MRKRFLVKPKLQITHLTWLLGLIFVAAGVAYVLFESILQGSLGNTVSLEEWTALIFRLRLGFLLVLSILLLAVGLESLFFFHRIVGPIYALEKGLKRLSKGDFHDRIQTRKYDELGELIESFEELKKHLWVRLENSQETALLLSKELDLVLKSPSPENIARLQEKLKEIKEQVVKKAA